MIRGFLKTTSRPALLAAAGILMGSYTHSPAKAADLGGSCCGDLEERVAELEATTARKGNRVVSLQVYGQINKALLIWDDGSDTDAFVVDNDYAGSRIGFTGKAAIKPGWTAGYLMELDIQDSASDKVNNGARVTGAGFKNGDEGNENEIAIRYNNVYIESERLGRITLGQGSTAADGANEVVLGNSLRHSDIQHGNSFSLRRSDGSFAEFTLGNIAANLDSSRDDVIRYDSPTIYGFILSASWGDNDYTDIVLRYKAEWNSIRIAGAIAYVWDASVDTSPTTTTVSLQEAVSSFEQVGGSISIQHIPTGIYVAFAAAARDYQEAVGTVNGVALSDSAGFWYLQGGVERKWLPYGSTTVYGEYAQYNDIAFDGSEATRWGFGVVQKIDSAAMELYAQATFWSFDGFSDVALTDPEDMTMVMIGSRIKF
jgi:hypothetical protein